MEQAEGLTVVREGLVSVLVPSTSLKDPYSARVFYNPRMEICRDIAVCCLKAYRRMSGRSLRVAEPLTATGVRGIRYAKEVDGVVEVVIGDVSPEAVALARRNVELNGLQGVVRVEEMEANALLSLYARPGMRFDAVDIDPFGTPAPFMDSAIRALNDGGLLMVTATDAPALCGLYPKVAERHYGGRPMRTEYCHEVAVRLIIGALCREAGKHDAAIRPVMAYSYEHHFRVYALLEVGATRSSEMLDQLGYAYHCHGCGARGVVRGVSTPLEPRCPRCGHSLTYGGPMWCGPLEDPAFTEAVLREVEGASYRLRRAEASLVRVLREEAEAPPLFYTLSELSRRLKVREPPMDRVLEELRSMGYRASRTHFHPKGFKTDADLEVVESIVRGLGCRR